MVAINSLITLYGNGLVGSATSSSYAASASYPWPRELGGTTVTIDDTPIPLLYVSVHQINALVPPQFQPGLHKLTVKKSGPESGGVLVGPLLLAPVLPALFGNHVIAPPSPACPVCVGIDHTDAAALDANNSLISESHPAVPGQFITLFATGLGAWRGDPPGLMRALVTPM